ncbi:MAG: hypothetical protein AB7E79_07765 [Rhodospirillaceae bacterium]
MGSLFSELKRRKVFRVAAAYLVGAWAILEFVSVVTPMLRLPEWAGPLVLMLLTIGFVTAVALSWMFEMTADGLKRTAPVGSVPAVSSKLDWALIAASLAIIALISYQQIFTRFERAADQRVVSTAPAPDGISIAVLPFVNLSSDPEQEFFSDGMTEEITSALAKVKALRVVGRTSAFEFKGQNKDLRAIGQALGASHLLEGSVRKSGNRVRITGQLIKADDGTHIWTENYDRELTDIFATQDDIARAIAAALQTPLGLAEGEGLVAHRTANTDSYQDYLRARALYRARDLEPAIATLEKSLAADQGYVPAWALLAQAYAVLPVYALSMARGSNADLSPRYDALAETAEHAAAQALRLAPRNASAHAALAFIAIQRRMDWFLADEHFRQALALDPADPDALHFYSLSQAFFGAGYLKRMLGIREELRRLEPFVPIYNALLGTLFTATGQYSTAIDLFNGIPSTGPINFIRNHELAAALAHSKRFDEAANVLLSIEERPNLPRASIEAAARVVRAGLHPLKDPGDVPHQFGWIYAFSGAPEKILDQAEREIAIPGAPKTAFSHVWYPAFADLRKTSRFKKVMREAKLVDFWRARGWPDLCRPVGADDFECD